MALCIRLPVTVVHIWPEIQNVEMWSFSMIGSVFLFKTCESADFCELFCPLSLSAHVVLCTLLGYAYYFVFLIMYHTSSTFEGHKCQDICHGSQRNTRSMEYSIQIKLKIKRCLIIIALVITLYHPKIY